MARAGRDPVLRESDERQEPVQIEDATAWPGLEEAQAIDAHAGHARRLRAAHVVLDRIADHQELVGLARQSLGHFHEGPRRRLADADLLADEGSRDEVGQARAAHLGPLAIGWTVGEDRALDA